MPAYNAGLTIDAALASVAGQSVVPDEVVVMDDASTDDTVDRLARWSAHLPLVVVRRDANGGCGLARSDAIAHATGTIIASLDADDVWLPDHLEQALPLARDPSTIVAVTPCLWQHGRGLAAFSSRRPGLPAADDQPGAILRYNFLFVGSIAWREAMVPYNVISRRRAEDWERWIRMIVEGGCRVVAGPHSTVLYRISATSVSAGDACLEDDVSLYRDLLREPAYAGYHDVIRAGIRRRGARRAFVDAVTNAAAGRHRDARHGFVEAIRIDPSLRGGRGPSSSGSVAARALVGTLAPGAAARWRARHLARAGAAAVVPG